MPNMNTKREKFVVAGLGEVLWDMLPDGRKLGGAPTNFAYHSHALGAEGVIVSCVGDDELGREIFSLLEGLNVNRQYVFVDDSHPTGTVTVELDDQGQPDYIIHEDVAWDFIPFGQKLEELTGQVNAICFGSLCQRRPVSRATVRKFLQATTPHCIRVFDVNLRQSYYNREVIDNMLKLTNVFKLNDQELEIIAALLEIVGTESEILQGIIARYGLELIAMTKGAQGSILLNREQSSVLPAESVKVVDTVGAGDAFAAAVTIGLLRGQELDDIHKSASRLAGFVCSQPGATPKIPPNFWTVL